MIDEEEVSPLGKRVEWPVCLRKEVPDHDLTIMVLSAKRDGQVAGRGVMSLSKSRGEDEDRWFHRISCKLAERVSINSKICIRNPER